VQRVLGVRVERLWFVEKAKRRRIVVVFRRRCERRVRISIGARIPGKRSCLLLF